MMVDTSCDREVLQTRLALLWSMRVQEEYHEEHDAVSTEPSSVPILDPV